METEHQYRNYIQMDNGVVPVNESKTQVPTVAVLMSTYNGERYLREQLESLFIQEDVNVRLYIRDDGSTDSTLTIVDEFAQHFPITLMEDCENVGSGESFMRILYAYADDPMLDYFAFADQDDIWLPDKLSSAVLAIEKTGIDGPILYCSNQVIYENGEVKRIRYAEPQNVQLIPHITENTISGCTFVFNKDLALLVARADRPDSRVIKYRLHDAWIMLVAICCGRVIYDEEPHMLYRIHDNNVVGIRQIAPIEKIERMRNLISKSGQSNLRSLTARELLRLFPQIRGEDREILELFAHYRKSWDAKRCLIMNKKVRGECPEHILSFCLKVVLSRV